MFIHFTARIFSVPGNIAVRVIIFHLPGTCINSRLQAVIVNDPFHFFLEKKWSKKSGSGINPKN